MSSTSMRENHKPWLIPLIVVIALAVLTLDSFTALGTADYIFYFLPVTLTVLDTRPRAPILAVTLCTFLSIVGFFISPSGLEEYMAGINRSFAVFTLWAIAFLVQQIIFNKNKIAKESWLKDGTTLLAENMRGEFTAEELVEKILDFFGSYINMQNAGAYLKSDKGYYLEYIGGYAFTGDTKRTINYGEGAVGQSILSKKTIIMTPLPPNYIKVSSGLGEESPIFLIVIPLVADEMVIGCIELAFLKTPSDTVIEFIERAKEGIAIALRSSLHKAKLAELLYQSQQLTEELQAQQEELKVSNEELEQQSKVLKETHIKLENQQSELEQSNQQLEEQAQTLEHQKNQLDEKNSALLKNQYELLSKAREIEKSSQYKSEFLANMSHELRTPLNSTLILAKLLADNKPKTLTEEQVKYAEIIHSSGTDLLNLINDILDLSKVEAGKLTIVPAKVPLSQMAESLFATFSEQAKIKKLEFSVELSADLPSEIITDRQRLEQILKNFISNALKFTEKGFIKLLISGHEDKIHFSLSDSGIGISKEQQEIIFEAFRQADGTTNRKYGGTGLGLSISRQLAKVLGGEIVTESALGKGSTFTLILPREFEKHEFKTDTSFIPTAREKTKGMTLPFQNFGKEDVHLVSPFSFKDDRETIFNFSRKILIIEDDEAFAKILFDLAHEMNFGALVAASAQEGMQLVGAFNPHAIVLDVRLPDYSGLLVLDHLKMNSATRHIPVHVISSSDFTKSALEMGAIGYILKPVKREELQKTFESLTSHIAQTTKHVLIVEDDPIQRNHIIQLLAEPNITVDAVENATDALKKLAEKVYDCMIMDLSLPDLSGYELLSKMSGANSQYSYPPVIIHTARDLTAEEEEKLRLYSGSIIIKGARSPERLLNEVMLFIHKVETELPPERQKILRDLRTREKTLEDRTILIVDDDVRNIFALTSALENFGANIVVARNGVEALQKVSETPNLDLVLMDIMMPEMDGYEAMRRLRKDKRYEKLPIIALTAKAMKDDHQNSLDAGASDYLSKPIDIDKLISLIRVWLPVNRGFLK